MRFGRTPVCFFVVFSLLWTFCLTNKVNKIPPKVWTNQAILNNHDFIKEMLVLNENMSNTNVKQLINNTGKEFESVDIRNWTKTEDGFIKIEQSYSDHMANVLAPSSGCEPKATEVAMPVDPDPHVMIWPQCTPVDRCGGCCGNPMLVCAPTLTEKIMLKVLKARYQFATSNFEYQKFDDVIVEKHLACKCQCRVQPKDCNIRQYYHEPLCSCRCKREYRTSECYDRRKTFNDITCECVCAHREECDAGFYFDENICRCLSKKMGASLPAGTDTHRPYGGRLTGTQSPRCRCPKGFVIRLNRSGTCRCHPASGARHQQPSQPDVNRHSELPPVPVPVDPLRPHEDIPVPVDPFGHGDFGLPPHGPDDNR